MAIDEVLSVLTSLSFASGLSRHTLTALAGASVIERLPAGAIVFREGQMCPDLYLLVEGRVSLQMHVPGRGDVAMLSVGRGEFLGWSPLLGGGAVTATALVSEPCMLIRIAAAELHELCREDSKLGYEVMTQIARALAHRLLATRLQLLDMFADGRSAPFGVQPQ
ncbi:MAG: cyclic nucleotide-binding domain-containing protein [Pirellulales bacterium]|nr:cyclic nucleotide-binding domain-containing protein [Pirellulales bacterium]